MSDCSDRRRYRRRGPLSIECADRPWVDLAALLAGRIEPGRHPVLRAFAPPSAESVEISVETAHCLTLLSDAAWTPLPTEITEREDVAPFLQRLLDAHLIECADGDAQPPPAPPRFEDWWRNAALYHFSSRWSGCQARDDVPSDPASAEQAFATSRREFELQAEHRGNPPTHCPDRGNVAAAIALPRPPPTAFDHLLAARETHRLYDTSRPLTQEQLGQLLYRSFAAIAEAPLGGGLTALRKHAPSGGGMHPVEAYPLIVDVEGLPSGWYHYRSTAHALAPMVPLATDAARAAITQLTAGQAYFASAAVIVALTLRFPRHHWKYPRHAKAYRVMLLELGHLGQTFYLAATEAGLGAFVTAAVNDADVDTALGLDGVEEGCIAIVGCGVPSPQGQALRLSGYVAAP